MASRVQCRVTAKSSVNKDHRCDSHKMCRDKIGLCVPSYPQDPQCVYNPTGLRLCVLSVLGSCDAPKLHAIIYTELFFKYMCHYLFHFLFFLGVGALITSSGLVLYCLQLLFTSSHTSHASLRSVRECNMTELCRTDFVLVSII